MAAASSLVRPYKSCYHCNEALTQAEYTQCGHCHSAFYCSEEHGLADWNLHKEFCRPQPHTFEQVVNFWVPKAKDSWFTQTTKQFQVITFHDTTATITAVETQKVDTKTERHIAQRVANLSSEQVLFVTKGHNKPSHHYDGLFIYRLVKEKSKEK